MTRFDAEKTMKLRKIKITRNYIRSEARLVEIWEYEGLCTASLDDKVPPFRRGRVRAVTAEYNIFRGRHRLEICATSQAEVNGRRNEIQRRICRSLRSLSI